MIGMPRTQQKVNSIKYVQYNIIINLYYILHKYTFLVVTGVPQVFKQIIYFEDLLLHYIYIYNLTDSIHFGTT